MMFLLLLLLLRQCNLQILYQLHLLLQGKYDVVVVVVSAAAGGGCLVIVVIWPG